MMIELRKITKEYTVGDHPVTALKEVSLSLNRGDFTALVGSSGCGKSTTMAIIGLLDRPTSGHYLLNGEETALLSGLPLAQLRNKTFGFIFQSFYLLPRLSALDNVALPLVYRGLNEPVIKKKAMATLEHLNIAHLAQHKPGEMSGGQQQRVAIARALVGDPSVILADEPTGALDSKTGQALMDDLIKLNKEQHTTILLVTHDHLIAQQCKAQWHMKDGVLVNRD